MKGILAMTYACNGQSWRILFRGAEGSDSVIVEAYDRRAAKEVFLAGRPDVRENAVIRVVLVPG